LGKAETQISLTKEQKVRLTTSSWSLLTYGGCANGIPKNWETLPEVVPVKVPLSRVTVGAAIASPMMWVATRSEACRFMVEPAILHPFYLS